MQPNRRRFKNSTEAYEALPGVPGTTLPIRYQYIDDVNNKRARPLSPCHGFKCVTQPRYVRTLQGNDWAFLFTGDTLEGHVNDIMGPTIEMHLSRCERWIAKKRRDLVGDFSTLNFLYELREVGNLIKDSAGKIRAFNSYRPIDYIFGVAPMLSDLVSGLNHYNKIASQTNQQLKAFKNVEVNRRFMDTVDKQGEYSFNGAGNFHYQSDKLTITTRVKGVLSCGVPWLTQLAPEVFVALARAGIDPSPANAFNAIPFSWAADWFFPFGDFLSSLPTLMKPEFFFNGTISSKIKGFHETETRYSGPGFSFPHGEAGSSFATTCYTRTPLIGSLTGKTRWDFAGGVNSASRALVARDIIAANKPRGRFDKLFL